jgi:hypothetical protein
MPACCGGDGHAVPRAKGREGIGRARDMEEADLPRATHMHDATTLVPADPGAACTSPSRDPLDSPAVETTRNSRVPRAHGRRGATEPTIGREVRCIRRPCFIRRVAAETDYLRAGKKRCSTATASCLPLRIADFFLAQMLRLLTRTCTYYFSFQRNKKGNCLGKLYFLYKKFDPAITSHAS